MRLLRFLLLIAISSTTVFALGSRERVDVEGFITIKGTHPYNFVALTHDSDVYELTGDKADEIGDSYQNYTLRVQGSLVDVSGGSRFPVIRVDSYEVVETQ
jgi:uncharacterized membrane protein YcgQ (UPF0703/DUF1980 family)